MRLGHVCMQVVYNVDTTWYRGAQPSGMVGQPTIYGSASQASTNLYGDGSHAGHGTEFYAGSAAAAFAQQGIVPAPDITDYRGGSLPRIMGLGSPIGVVAPTVIGMQYEDYHTGQIWIANGLTASSWTQKK